MILSWDEVNSRLYFVCMALFFLRIFLHFEILVLCRSHIPCTRLCCSGEEALLILALFGQVEGNVNKKCVCGRSLGAYLDLCMLK